MRTIGPLRPGDPRRLGEYEVRGRIGRGGQGEVYLAESPAGQRVAAKVLNTDSWTDERAQRLFMREVALAKQVARFCTAQVLDAGMVDGGPYLISEFIDGLSLAETVAYGGPLSGGALERLAIGTATALTAIHRAGIVHRDFKPGNVLVGPDGPRVIDFGIAREAAAPATNTSQIMGTPAFISPEQLAGSPAGAASDVFAWGVTMAFAATGEAPFGQDSIPAVINRVLRETPDLSEIQLPLRALVAGCLAKDPARRPTSEEVLLTLLGGAGVVPAGVRARGLPLRRTVLTAAVALLVGGGAGAAAAAPRAAAVSSLPPQTTITTAPPRATITPTPSMPLVAGLLQKDALSKLQQSDLTPGKITLNCSGGVTPGRIASATRRPGTRVVDLVVGAAKARIPDARGWPLTQGRAAVRKAGFSVTVSTKRGRDWIGKIAAVNPAPGTTACTGTQVTLSIGVR